MNKRFDVCVVGAGPAGATVAARLSTWGYRVLIVEGRRTRRRRLESLSGAVEPALELLGVSVEFERLGPPRPETIVHWAGSTFVRPAETSGRLVDRDRFDALLLEAAVRAGAATTGPALSQAPVRLEPGKWRIPIDRPGGWEEIECRFLVDASGSGGRLAGTRIRLSEPTVAISAVWNDVPITTTAAYVEAGREAWLWGASAEPGRFHVLVFLDSGRRSDTKRLDELYTKSIGESKLFRACLNGVMSTPVVAHSAAVTFAEESIGLDWIKVGDAALTLDPLSSQGVSAALTGGLQASVVVNTLLRNPGSAAAQSFYRDRLSEAAQLNIHSAAAYYAEQAAHYPTSFWRRRAARLPTSSSPAPLPPPWRADTCVRRSPDLRFEPTPVLVGDLIETNLAGIHPALPRPVNWLAGRRFVDLVGDLDGTRTAAEVVRRWDAEASTNSGVEIMNWLWNHGLVSAASPLCASRPAPQEQE